MKKKALGAYARGPKNPDAKWDRKLKKLEDRLITTISDDR